MSDQGDDKQGERPVRPSEYGVPCDRCLRNSGHDGYSLPRTFLPNNAGDAGMVLCAQCLRDALANLQTEQARIIPRTLIPSPASSPLPSRANPGVGGGQEGAPELRCSRCGGGMTMRWVMVTEADGTARWLYCSYDCEYAARDGR